MKVIAAIFVITAALEAHARLNPPMPVSYYAKLSADDLSAIVAHLRRLPAK